MTVSSPTVSGRIGRQAIELAPFGVHTRFMLTAYLRHAFLICCALLAIALTIDIWPQFRLISDSGEPGVLHTIWRIARFELLRTPDLLSPLVPFAIFSGVVWSEIAHTQSGERMLIWNSGRSPFQCLVPAVLLGVIIGTTLFITDAYLGPAAMLVQMQERLGLNGKRLDRTHISGSHWIASPDGLIRTEIVYGPPTILRNLTIYKLDQTGRLTAVESAAEAQAVPGTEMWTLTNGHYWLGSIDASGAPGSRSTSVEFGGPPEETLLPFAKTTVSLKISPLWMSKLGIDSQYLALWDLQALTQADTDPLTKLRYKTRVQTVYADLLFPAVMAVLAALLSIRSFAYRTPPRALIGVLFTGYLAHFANKAFVLMGTHGYMAAGFAAWTIPIAVLIGIASIVWFSAASAKPPPPREASDAA